jgi:hypothetical protein
MLTGCDGKKLISFPWNLSQRFSFYGNENLHKQLFGGVFLGTDQRRLNENPATRAESSTL